MQTAPDAATGLPQQLLQRLPLGVHARPRHHPHVLSLVRPRNLVLTRGPLDLQLRHQLRQLRGRDRRPGRRRRRPCGGLGACLG